MSDTVYRIDVYSFQAKPSEARAMLDTLRRYSVDLLAFHAFPAEGGLRIELMPKAPESFEAIANASGWNAIGPPEKAFLLESGYDRAGKTADLFDRLAEHGIEIAAISSLGADRGCHELFRVPHEQVGKTATLLGAIEWGPAVPMTPSPESVMSGPS